MSNDSKISKTEDIDAIQGEEEKKKKEEVEIDKKLKVKVVKVTSDGSLAETLGESLLEDDKLKTASHKNTLVEIDKDTDVDNFNTFLQKDGDVTKVTIAIPTTESVSPKMKSLISFAKVKGIPVITRGE